MMLANSFANGRDTMSTSATSKECRATNGVFFRIEGEGEPLLLLHGLMATGAMFDPLIELLRMVCRRFAADLDIVLAEGWF
jgi:hypothetical protein